MEHSPPPSYTFRPDAAFNFHGLTILIGSNNPSVVKGISKEIGILSSASRQDRTIRFYFNDLSLPPRTDFQAGILSASEQVHFMERLTGNYPFGQSMGWIDAAHGFSEDEALLASINSIAHLAAQGLERARNTLTFHAAVLLHEDAGLLLTGESGAGKTTLSMVCNLHGFRYVTDEWSFLSSPPLVEVAGFPRSFRVHGDIATRNADLIAQIGKKEFSAFGDRGFIVTPSSLCRNDFEQFFPLRAIIALNKNEDISTPLIQPLGRSDALFTLLNSILMANTEEEGSKAAEYNRYAFEIAEQIQKQVPIYQLDYNITGRLGPIPSLIRNTLWHLSS